MRFERKTFTGQRVEIDGNEYEECRFVESEIVWNGQAAFALNGCKFDRCSFGFDGAAGNTLQGLAALYADPGFRPIIEATLENIRAGRVGQKIPLH